MHRRRVLFSSSGCLLLALIYGWPTAAPGVLSWNVLAQDPPSSSSVEEDLPAWPPLSQGQGDAFRGGPVGVRYSDGVPVLLPGVRDSGDREYVRRDGPLSGQQHPFTGEFSDVGALSWNALMLMIGLSTPPEGVQPGSIGFGSAASVWLPDADALDGCVVEDGISLCSHLPLTIDARGRLSGTGSLEVSGVSDGLPIHGTLSGPLWGYLLRWATQSDTRVVVKTRLSGTLEIDGIPVPTTIWTTLMAQLTPDGSRCDPASVEACLFGDLRTWMLARIPGAGPVRSQATAPFVREVARDEGRWALALSAGIDSRNRLAGDAMVSVGNGEPKALLSLTVGGQYFPWRDLSQLWLRPSAPGVFGSRIALWGVESELGQIHDAHVFFDLFGQRGRVRLSEDACCGAVPLAAP